MPLLERASFGAEYNGYGGSAAGSTPRAGVLGELWGDLSDSVRGQMRKGQIRKGQIRKGQMRKGQMRKGQIRKGQMRKGQIRKGQIRHGARPGEWRGAATRAPCACVRARVRVRVRVRVCACLQPARSGACACMRVSPASSFWAASLSS
eukprot:1974747-Prymnesium_polylepis.1